MSRSLQEYAKLVAGTTTGLSLVQIDEAAAICFASQFQIDVGQQVIPVWHAVSVITDTLDKCHCAPCEMKRKKPNLHR